MNNNSSKQIDTHHRGFQAQSAGYSGELNINDNADFETVRPCSGLPSREHVQDSFTNNQKYSRDSVDRNQCRSRGGEFHVHGESRDRNSLQHQRHISRGNLCGDRNHTDFPGLSNLRNDPFISGQVNRRFGELGLEEDFDESDFETFKKNRKGKKSGLSRTIEDQVVREIDWPHLYIYRGYDRRPTHFNELTIAEFVHGYISMVDNPRNNFNIPVMMKILKDMMADTAQYSWLQVRNIYRVLASGIEMARYNWDDSTQVAALRAQYAQRPTFHQTQQPTRPPTRVTSLQPPSQGICMPYQQLLCSEADSHQGLKHVCSYCLSTTGLYFSHPEKECRRKYYQSKNEQRGGGQ